MTRRMTRHLSAVQPTNWTSPEDDEVVVVSESDLSGDRGTWVVFAGFASSVLFTAESEIPVTADSEVSTAAD